MESMNYHEESSEGVVDEDVGVGRSYECVFCKRGFNTAQALGGHMNIHRKHRSASARNKPKLEDAPRILPSSPHLLSNSTLYESNYHHPYTSPSNPGDWRMRLALDKPKLPINQDKELNLELRLGYD